MDTFMSLDPLVVLVGVFVWEVTVVSAGWFIGAQLDSINEKTKEIDKTNCTFWNNLQLPRLLKDILGMGNSSCNYPSDNVVTKQSWAFGFPRMPVRKSNMIPIFLFLAVKLPEIIIRLNGMIQNRLTSFWE